MICPSCQGVQLKAAFGADGVTYTCLAQSCGATFRDSPAQHQELQAPVTKTRVAAPVAAKPARKIVSDRDVVRMARGQLKTLNAEIKRLEKLKVQRDALVRLLAAADARPEGAANVRPLRASQGK